MKANGWRIRISSLISFCWSGWLPRLVLHEKLETQARWISRTIAVVAIASSVATFSTWHYSLSFAISIFLLEQWMERVLFEYTSIYVQPLPGFRVHPGEWVGLGCAVPVPKSESSPILVGPAFLSEEYARRFFSLLSDWNYGAIEDRDDNICMSVVLGADEYAASFYPSLDRYTVRMALDEVEEAARLKKYGKKQQRLVVQMVFAKWLPYSTGVRRFIAEWKPGQPFWLQAFQLAEDGSLKILFNIKPILKWHCKVAAVDSLKPQDVEYRLIEHERK